jgi:hypothetical protein
MHGTDDTFSLAHGTAVALVKQLTVSPAASRGKLRAMGEGAQLARREVEVT